MDFVLHTNDIVKSEPVSEKFMPDMEDPTDGVSFPNEIEDEFSQTELHLQVKDEESSFCSADVLIKSEPPDVKFNEDNIEGAPLQSEEVYIKAEIDESSTDQIIKNVEHFNSLLCKTTFPVEDNSREKKLYTECSVSYFTCKCKSDVKIHTGEKPFKCNLCGYGSVKNCSFFKCNICGYNCAWKCNLSDHLKTHTGEKPFQCNVCDYSSVRKSGLREHVKIHTGEKPFKCNICDYKCVQKQSLQRHIKTHTGEKPFKCNLCVYRCSDKYSLNLHVKIHSKDKPFKCSACNFSSVHKKGLQRHVLIHTGQKPFQCNVCAKRFLRKHGLKQHIKIHTGEENL